MLLSGVPQSLQSEGKRTEKTFRRMVCRGAKTTARCGARCLCRSRSSVSRLLKTTLHPSDQHQVGANLRNPSPVPPGARGAMVDALIRSRSTVTPQYMSLDAKRAMLEEVPKSDFTEIS
jgi:hypothetical protein